MKAWSSSRPHVAGSKARESPWQALPLLSPHVQERLDPDPFQVITDLGDAEEDYAELIAAGPAVGFLSKATLSGQRIRERVNLASHSW
jgi:hypothetical protein